MIIELLFVASIGFLINGPTGAAWAIVGYFVFILLAACFAVG